MERYQRSRRSRTLESNRSIASPAYGDEQRVVCVCEGDARRVGLQAESLQVRNRKALVVLLVACAQHQVALLHLDAGTQ
jgi:hypothetical protein